MRRLVMFGAAVCLLAGAAYAQDPVKVDPAHYKVMFENAQVRVLKIHYGPHEKSVMHVHPDSVVTYLTDATTKFTMPDGTSQVRTGKAGEALWTPAETHLPENIGDTAFEATLVELKHRPATHTAMKAPPATHAKQGS
jgi:quercetin dioxygenase-like cupin family protein